MKIQTLVLSKEFYQHLINNITTDIKELSLISIMCEEMSIALNILHGLKLTGLVSVGYIGYRYGDVAKKWCCKNIPKFGSFHKDHIETIFTTSQTTEKTTFNLVGLFSGILTGFYIWPIAIPSMVYQISEDYPEEIKKIKKGLNLK
jgi:hypothetical protein